MLKRLCAVFLLIAVSICCASAAGLVPSVNADMGCTTAGQPLYYNGTSIVCGSPSTLLLGGETITGGSAPTIAAGSGAGTSPTVSVTGAQNSQSLNITTGTCTVACPASATVATVTLPSTCPTQATPTLTPTNAAAAVLSASGSIYVTPQTTGYLIKSGTTGLVASTAYTWSVHVDCW